MQSRNASVEIYRCSLMFGICLLHIIYQGGYPMRGFSDCLRPCVDGFVFISGYFGIRFSWRKAVGLATMGFFCAVVSVTIDAIFFDTTWHSIPMAVLRQYADGFWFLWAYLVLMAFAPILESAVAYVCSDRRKLVETFVPVLAVVFGWMYLDHVPRVNDFVPTPRGFGMLTFLCLIGIYVAARLFRLLGVEEWLRGMRLVIVFLVCFTMCWLGFMHYESIFALGLAASTFVIFKRIQFPVWVEKLALGIAPSMFAVYLLHSSGYGFRICWHLCRYLVVDCGVPIWLTWVVTGLIVFVGGVAIDLSRRFVLRQSGLIRS